MKPKDLPTFYKNDERKPIIQDRVFCVPRNYDDHEKFEMPDLSKEIFQNDHPISIEFCSGNGEWIAECAKEYPDINWIAVERKFKRVRKIWSKMKNHDLKNLFIVCGNAEDFAKYYLPKGSVSSIYINFPDPWPKLKHVKKRLIQGAFITMMEGIAAPNAVVTIVTDDLPYAEFSIKEMLSSKVYHPLYAAPYYTQKPSNYGSSYFNRLWLEKGREIHFIQFSKSEI